MKKTFKVALLSLSLVASALVASPLSKGELNNIVKSNPTVLNQKFVKIIGSDKKDGFSLLKIKAIQSGQIANAFVVDSVKDVIFFGAAIDSKTGKPIVIPPNPKIIKDAVAFTYGDGDKEIYVFSDPECPWCQKLEKSLDLTKYKVHYIPVPLQMHKNSKSVLAWVFAGKNQKEQSDRLHNYMTGKDTKSWKNFKSTKEQSKNFESILEKASAATSEINLRGTPTVLDKDMNPVNVGTLLK